MGGQFVPALAALNDWSDDPRRLKGQGIHRLMYLYTCHFLFIWLWHVSLALSSSLVRSRHRHTSVSALTLFNDDVNTAYRATKRD